MSQLSLFKSPSFILICISSFVDALAFYTPHMFLAGNYVLFQIIEHVSISKQKLSINQ